MKSEQDRENNMWVQSLKKDGLTPKEIAQRMRVHNARKGSLEEREAETVRIGEEYLKNHNK
jgi:hypothetical protein